MLCEFRVNAMPAICCGYTSRLGVMCAPDQSSYCQSLVGSSDGPDSDKQAFM